MNMPDYVSRYFWGDDLHELDIVKHEKYIVQVILEQGDLDAVHWLFNTYSSNQIQGWLPKLSLSKKSANYWSIYFS